MLKIEKTVIQNGPHLKNGYAAVPKSGNTPKDAVRYHIDQEVGDVYDLLADMSKMIWLLNRKVNGEVQDGDIELEEKLKSRMTQIDNIVENYYK
jgi:hypothetical protein